MEYQAYMHDDNLFIRREIYVLTLLLVDSTVTEDGVSLSMHSSLQYSFLSLTNSSLSISSPQVWQLSSDADSSSFRLISLDVSSDVNISSSSSCDWQPSIIWTSGNFMLRHSFGSFCGLSNSCIMNSKYRRQPFFIIRTLWILRTCMLNLEFQALLYMPIEPKTETGSSLKNKGKTKTASCVCLECNLSGYNHLRMF